MEIEKDSAQVNTPPPLIALAALLLGSGLQWLHPLNFISGLPRWTGGGLLFACGFWVMLNSVARFRQAGTNVEPWKATSFIVATGFYRMSRNPIYLAMLMVLAGIGLLANSLWILIMALPLGIALRFLVIAKEERYLESKFGQDYLAYKARVRRWL